MILCIDRWCNCLILLHIILLYKLLLNNYNNNVEIYAFLEYKFIHNKVLVFRQLAGYLLLKP